MQYKIEGGSLPIVEVSLENGETIITQGGGMVWMSPNLNMETSGGGVGKMFSKMVSGESIMQNRYTAMGGPGFITLASSFPGSIIPFEIQPNMPIIVQKSGFLASSATVSAAERTPPLKRLLPITAASGTASAAATGWTHWCSF